MHNPNQNLANTVRTLALGLLSTVVLTICAQSVSADSGKPRPDNWTYLETVYHAAQEKIVLLGGIQNQGDGSNFTSEVWTFDPRGKFGAGGRWELVNTEAPEIDEAVYDSAANRILAVQFWEHNPNGSNPWFELDPVSRLWAYELETNTWVDLSPAGGPEPELAGTGLIYDAESNKTILYGGLHLSDFYFSDKTWAYDYDANTWTDMQPAESPGARNYFGFTYHASLDKAVLMGGFNSDFAPDNTVATYDYNTNTWTRKDGSTAPVRDYPTLAYNPENDQVLMFGGVEYADPPFYFSEIAQQDTWHYDLVSDTWTELDPIWRLPGRRGRHGMAYHEGKGRMLMFGGDAERMEMYNDVWEFYAGRELSGNRHLPVFWRRLVPSGHLQWCNSCRE